jgi:predicted hydrocarbon binding protein
MKSCCLASGAILGRRVAQELGKPASLEEFLQEFAEKGRAYLSYTYEMLNDGEALLRIERSAFWEVIKGTSIDKIKKAGCNSEFRFIEAALGSFFDAEVERRRCYWRSSEPCEFVVRIRR